MKGCINGPICIEPCKTCPLQTADIGEPAYYKDLSILLDPNF